MRAWISPEQCGLNAQRAAQGNRAPRGSELAIQTFAERKACPGCPGVVELAQRMGTKGRALKANARGAAQHKRRRKTKRIRPMKNEGKPREPLVTLPEIAREIGRDVRAMRKPFQRSGIKPVFSARGRVPAQYLRSEVDAWVERTWSKPQQQPAAEEAKQASPGFWSRKTLSRPLTKQILEAMGTDAAKFAEHYEQARRVARGGFGGRTPSEKEIQAVEKFQRTGDLLGLRKALGCSATRSYSLVARVTAWQAWQRKGAA